MPPAENCAYNLRTRCRRRRGERPPRIDQAGRKSTRSNAEGLGKKTCEQTRGGPWRKTHKMRR
eukprot:1467425-Lingulodinium_polyedra.AAC.1